MLSHDRRHENRGRISDKVYDKQFFDELCQLRHLMFIKDVATALGIGKEILKVALQTQKVRPKYIERSREVFPKLFANPRAYGIHYAKAGRRFDRYGFIPNAREKLALAEESRRNQERANRLRSFLPKNAVSE